MSNAVVIISSETSYLEDKTAALGYDVYAFDEYTHKNLNKVSNIKYLKSFIKNISNQHQNIYLIYGSGLEDKKNIYEVLNAHLIINCNTLDLLRKSGDLCSLKDMVEGSDLRLPSDTNANSLTTRLISKPLHSYGGFNIRFETQYKEKYYTEQYIPGDTYSASFFINDENFMFLGFNKLLLLKAYKAHPFIHAGAIMYNDIKDPQKIIRSMDRLSRKLEMKGYNSIDFKIHKKQIFIVDINPRITSTFKIYNDIYNNSLLNHQINPYNIIPIKKINKDKKYGFVNIFVKEKTKYDYDLSNDNAFINTPKMGDIVEKDQPLLSIYLNANNSGLLLRKLKQKISITTNLFSCYDIDI